MIAINNSLKAEELREKINLLWKLSGEKINRIVSEYDETQGATVFTVDGKYATRGWSSEPISPVADAEADLSWMTTMYVLVLQYKYMRVETGNQLT